MLCDLAMLNSLVPNESDRIHNAIPIADSRDRVRSGRVFVQEWSNNLQDIVDHAAIDEWLTNDVHEMCTDGAIAER